jgi:Pyruvate-formate lyase
MEFYTAFSEKRPVRLSDATRRFAWESLHGCYGDNAMKTPYVAMDEVDGLPEMSPQQLYNAAVLKIAREAPIRICEHESVSGAATLGLAMQHLVPACINGRPIQFSVSHLTIDFFTVVFCGVDSLEEKIQKRYKEYITPEQKEQLDGMLNVINAMHIYHSRYLDELKTVKPENYKNLKNVPFAPAANFKEAVQSIWFTFAFVRLYGNWPGIGRLDQLLGGFLAKDLEKGAITLDEAREFLAGMFIKGCEWIQSDTPCGSGDAQHYQNIVLGGIDENGVEITNDATYLILDIVEELAIGDFPITIRINENTPEKLLTRATEVMRHGGGTIAVYNETLIIKSLVAFGYNETEARKFANDGCWEVQIPGKTCFNYYPFDSLQILLDDTLKLDSDTPVCFDSFGMLYEAFRNNLKNHIEQIFKNIIGDNTYGSTDTEWRWPISRPSSVVSLFEEGCIEKGRSYLDGGPAYVVCSPHIGGAPDVGNSLYAIDRLVFREKKVSFAELMTILKNDWEGQELLRQYVSNKFVYYGNDNDEADGYTVRVLNDFANFVDKLNGRSPILFPAGVSTFGRQIEWRSKRCAVPFGRKKGDILSGNMSPTPDTDFEGATAVIQSYCKADLSKQTSGAALDVKLFPSAVSGEIGLGSLKSLIRGFIQLGGFFMQLDVVDAEVLREAQLHPEQYKTLSVRVSGWNARFVTLNNEWQQMIIERNTQNI